MEICKLFPDREKWENYPKKIQFGIPNWLPTAMHGISGGETNMDRLHIAIALVFFIMWNSILIKCHKEDNKCIYFSS